MDIKKKIEEIIEKVKSDKSFASKFKDDPIQAVKSLIDVDISEDNLKSIVEGVKAKVNLDKAGDVLGKVKKLFK